ncbi:fimbrial protein [Citrobacter portucalensis]|uniref:fimbrial protein n=1 Tax=Citrobacter TaxID=544 RepID=UPI001A2CA22B|nr:fimbrial protein [Citrobacter sp. Cpo090]MDM2842885.1 fimbrial protein [Citrobacter sp. Cpo090]
MNSKFCSKKFNISISKYLLLAIVLAGIYPTFCFSASECHYVSGDAATVTFQNIHLETGLNQDTPVGTILFDQNNRSTQSGHFTCSGGAVNYSEGFPTLPATLVGSDPCLFNIPLTSGENSGLGLKIYYELNKKTSVTPSTYCMEFPKLTNSVNVTDVNQLQGNFRLILQVVGKLKGGAIDLSAFSGSGIWWNNVQGFELIFSDVLIDLKTLTCDVNTPDIPVSLAPAGGINADTTFKGVNSTSVPVDFNIDLTCAQGTSVAIRFEGQTKTGSNDSILKLTDQDNTATGIGVQILDKNKNAMTFNQPDFVLQASNVQQTQISLPFSAQYIQTDSQVTAGKADAEATFYLSFP